MNETTIALGVTLLLAVTVLWYYVRILAFYGLAIGVFAWALFHSPGAALAVAGALGFMALSLWLSFTIHRLQRRAHARYLDSIRNWYPR